MTRRPLSAVAAIGGFGIGVALLSVATTAAIVLVAPEPDGLRVSIRDAATALRSDVRGFTRSIGAEPTGRRATIFEMVLAGELRRSPADVRIVMTGPELVTLRNTTRSTPSSGPPVIVYSRSLGTRRSSDAPKSFTVQLANDDPQLLDPVRRPSAALSAGIATVPINAFIASVRQPDGRWLRVQPYEPWLSGWRLRVVAAILVSLLLIVPLAWAFARRLTRPFRVLAKAVDGGGTTPPIGGPRELREAAGAITAMRARLADETLERLRMLTAIAHDLRTPLTSLRLRIETVPEPQRARMVSDVDRMQAMINEVVDSTRAELERAPVTVRPLVASTVADLDAGRGIVTLASGGESVRVEVAESSLRRAVENLVRNAIDYAGGGVVSVTKEGQGAVMIAVSDRGSGIAVEDRERLVRPFERGEASRNRNTGGVGLGLSIVHDFAEKNGGTLNLRSREGGGLAVELRLPAL